MLIVMFVLAAVAVAEFIIEGQYKTGWRYYGFLTGAIMFTVFFLIDLWYTIRKREVAK